MGEVTNGTINSAHYGPAGDAARNIASYCEGDARAHVYAAAFTALTTAQAEIEALRARVAELEELLASEREDNLWNAYHTGHEKDGRWTHMFMSDGEWLVRQCGFDPRLPDYDAAEIKVAIPKAARTTLSGSKP